MRSEVTRSARAQVTVDTVETLEKRLLQFARNSIRWLEPRFPQAGVRESAQRGAWNDGDVRVLMQRSREMRGAMAIEITRLLRESERAGSVRVKAVGLSDGAAFEVTWSFSIGPDSVTGSSIELITQGPQENEVVEDFRGWFGEQ